MWTAKCSGWQGCHFLTEKTCHLWLREHAWYGYSCTWASDMLGSWWETAENGILSPWLPVCAAGVWFLFLPLCCFESLLISGAQSYSMACHPVQISARMEAKGQLYLYVVSHSLEVCYKCIFLFHFQVCNILFIWIWLFSLINLLHRLIHWP